MNGGVGIIEEQPQLRDRVNKPYLIFLLFYVKHLSNTEEEESIVTNKNLEQIQADIIQDCVKKNDEDRAKLFLERKAKKQNIFNNKKQPIGFGNHHRGGFGNVTMRKSSRGR